MDREGQGQKGRRAPFGVLGAGVSAVCARSPFGNDIYLG